MPSAHSYSSSSSQSGVNLPRTLAKPLHKEISRDSIACVAPELANVPPGYIRNGVIEQAPRMLSGNTCISLPSGLTKSRLPSSLTVQLRPSRSSAPPLLPTHLLAISQMSKGHSSSDSHVTLFPIHGIVFASHCANLPRLHAGSQQHSHTLQLPILTLSIPSPGAFSLIHSYLYTRSLEDLLSCLIPLPSSFVRNITAEAIQHTMTSRSKLHKLSMYLCSSSAETSQSIMSHASHVKELWQDCAALGVQSAELWECIDLAWEVVLGALNITSHGVPN
jgi:hypothetical protein